MLSAKSLRAKLDDYAEGRASAEAVEEWLASVSWDMRRWAPIGLQRVVESMQAAFISHSDGILAQSALHTELLQRREQLRRAHEATVKIQQEQAALESEVKNLVKNSTASEALTLRLEYAEQV